MKFRTFVTSVFAISSLVASAHAQDSCSQVLQFGIWDTRDTSNASAESKQVANWACSASSREGRLGFSYGQTKVDLGGAGNDNSCSSNNEAYSLSHYATEQIKNVSKALVTTWEQCMSRFGSYASILFRDDPRQLTIYVQTHGPESNKGRVQIKSVQQISCTQTKSALSNGVSYTGGLSIACTRPKIDEAINIDVNYPAGWTPQALYVPAVMRQPPAPLTPPRVISIETPVNSSDGPSWPRNENWWKATFPIQNPKQVGIGHLIEEPGFNPEALIGLPFAMHDHVYEQAYIPKRDRAYVTYTFDKPAEINEVQVIQHTNGITQIEGWIGSTEQDLKKFGVALSTRGDVKGSRVFPEASYDTFKFPQPGVGKVFRFYITRTSLPNGYAFYKAYPRNALHQEYWAARN